MEGVRGDEAQSRGRPAEGTLALLALQNLENTGEREAEAHDMGYSMWVCETTDK